jgi:hypothetical protein
MTHEIYNAAAILALAGAIAWFSVAVNELGRRRPTGCGRRGCRRSDGWQGCNHGRAAEGSAPGTIHHEEGR